MNATLNRIVFSLVVGACLTGCRPPQGQDSPPTRTADEKIVKSTPSAGLSLTPLDGGDPVQLDSFGNTDRLLVFFAPWTDSGPAVVQWISTLDAGRFKVVPVVVDRQENVSVPGLAQTAYRGNDVLMAAMGNIRVLPTAVWLTPESTIAGTWAGLPAFTGVVATIHNQPTVP